MEDHSFDELTKRFARPISRRGVLKAAAATVMGAILAKSGSEEALAVDPRCSGLGGRCNPGHRCCDHLVCIHTGPGANGTCGCPRNTVNRNGTCVCANTGAAPCGFNSDGTAICCDLCQGCDQSKGVCLERALPPCSTCDPTTGKVTSNCGTCQTCDTTAGSPTFNTCVSTCGTCPDGATCTFTDAGGCVCVCANNTLPCGGACCAACQTCSDEGVCVDNCPPGTCTQCNTTPGTTGVGTCVNACTGPNQTCCQGSGPTPSSVCCQPSSSTGARCFCETTTEGQAFCGQEVTSNFQPCPNGSSDCPAGQRCVVGTAGPICVPPCT